MSDNEQPGMASLTTLRLKPSENVIELLEELLEEAKSGVLQGIVLGFCKEHGVVGTTSAGEYKYDDLLMALANLQFSVMLTRHRVVRRGDLEQG